MYHKNEEKKLDQSAHIKEFRRFLCNEQGNVRFYHSTHLLATSALLEFMTSEYSSENLLFIISVMKFKGTYPSINPIRHTDLFNDAQEIYHQFIVSDSAQMVNLPADITDGMVLTKAKGKLTSI